MIYIATYLAIGWFVATIVLSIVFKLTYNDWDDEVDGVSYFLAICFWPILLVGFILVLVVCGLKNLSKTFYQTFFK